MTRTGHIRSDVGSLPRRPRSRARARTLLAGVTVAAALAAGCEGQNGDPGGPPDEDNGGSDGGYASPFTGLEAERGGPVLAVKIDNAPEAQPQSGLGAAEIVYVEEVEGGLSRLVGIYAGRLPDRVGPVRSARESDVELLQQFGEPALAYSGAQSGLYPILEESPLHPVSPTDAGDGYQRSTERPAPYNLYGLPERLLAATRDASEASDIGFRFDATTPDGGRPTSHHEVAYPSSSFDFAWSPERERWLVGMDGKPAAASVDAATVVVQRVTISDSKLHDVNGVPTPYTETVGSGPATVLRNGRAYEARWERTSAEEGTEFTRPNGEPMPFDPGPIWVVLAER